MIRRSFAAAAALLLVLLCMPAGAAAQLGSLKVVGIHEPVRLIRVTDTDGRVTEDFTNAGVSVQDLSQEKKSNENARKLMEYAVKNGITDTDATPDSAGTALFRYLEKGIYLVYSLAKDGEFDPFLVNIPTVINAEAVWDVEAKPKPGEKPQETTPTTPPTPTTVPAAQPTAVTRLPQTGTSVIPKYALMIAGTLLTLAGLVEVIRGREEETT